VFKRRRGSRHAVSDRAAARSIGESVQTGFEFARISTQVLRSAGAFGGTAAEEGYRTKEAIADLITVGSYLGGETLPRDSSSEAGSDKGTSKSQGGEAGNRSPDPTPASKGPTFEEIMREVMTLRADSNGNPLPDKPINVQVDPGASGEGSSEDPGDGPVDEPE
jgi:hypothetical protein